MSDGDALRAAIGMFYVPSRVHLMRSAPLPAGINLVLRLAAGDADAPDEAERLCGRSADVTRPAAIFFIEQVLLCSEGDSYRLLGLDAAATTAELRAHMALLLKWLHPDRNGETHRAHLAQRVIQAWDKVKTPERRQRYDAERPPRPLKPSRKSGSSRRFIARRKIAKPQRLISVERDFFLTTGRDIEAPAHAGRLSRLLARLFRFIGRRRPRRSYRSL
jgi:hypothetical protein